MSRSLLSTAEERREVVVTSAIHIFAERGFLGTPIAAVAQHAGISTAYVFKLFPGKTALFVAALEQCHRQVEAALEAGAQRAESADSVEVLHAMGGAYSELIADRDLLKLQVHALSASDEPKIAEAVRRGTAAVVRRAKVLSGGSDRQIQQFVAWGQLCHLVVTLDLVQANDDWALILTDGLRHPDVELGSSFEKGGKAD